MTGFRAYKQAVAPSSPEAADSPKEKLLQNTGAGGVWVAVPDAIYWYFLELLTFWGLSIFVPISSGGKIGRHLCVARILVCDTDSSSKPGKVPILWKEDLRVSSPQG